MDSKSQLKEQYKNTKPDMGILIIKTDFNKKYYIEASTNIRALINRSNFQLGAGLHKNKALQKDWTEKGESHFSIEILDRLEYDKEETGKDYKEELGILLSIWQEKLSKEDMLFYKA